MKIKLNTFLAVLVVSTLAVGFSGCLNKTDQNISESDMENELISPAAESPTDADADDQSSPLMTNTTIVVPDTDQMVSISSETGKTAEYGDREGAPEEGYGTVTLLDEYTQPLEGGNYVSVIAVNSGGSGSFLYLASFEPGEASFQMTDSEILGDRIDMQSVVVDETGKITVNYMEHGMDQAMAEDPNTSVSREFMYEDGELLEVSSHEL